MGLFDRLRGRRRSEDALAAARQQAPDAGIPAAPITGEHGEQIGAPPPAASFGGFSVGGLENMGALGPLIQQAIDSGHAQVYQAPPQVYNMTEHGDQARQEILDVLSKHGINAQPGSGQSIPVYDPNMMNEIFGVLGKYGMNPGTFQIPGMQPPPVPPGTQPGQIPPPEEPPAPPSGT
jgi:hypothetical protein